jgi:uncharacterized protein YndB with AHSA1/START domain
MQKEIRQTWFFKHTPQKVWEYLTNPALIEQWLGKTDLQPVVGNKFRFDGKNGCIIYCEVLEVKPFSKFSYSWKTSSEKDKKLFDSKVVWTLIPKENGTELQLVHDGFITAEDYTGHNNGWITLGKRFSEILS